ncbi:MAG: antibiotic biosynthesis monooxygenase [Sulfitobacter sp.]
MQALLFEVTPRDRHEDHYFRHAGMLRPILMEQDGLIFIERFKSLTRPKVILSHSLWRDEASIARWRTERHHHTSQTAGRFEHFEDYRIRISHVLSHIAPDQPSRSWPHDGAYSDAAATPDRFLTIIRVKSKPDSATREVFQSVTEPDSYLLINTAPTEAESRTQIEHAQTNPSVISALMGRVSRDYGMFERAEAPQYFADVVRPA